MNLSAKSYLSMKHTKRSYHTIFEQASQFPVTVKNKKILDNKQEHNGNVKPMEMQNKNNIHLLLWHNFKTMHSRF